MKKSHYIYLLYGIIAVGLFVQPAWAAKKVRSPYVEKGEWSLEHYGSYGFDHENSSDDYEYKSKTSVGYGLTDWWKVEIEAVLKNQPGDNTEYNATELVNKFQFGKKGRWPIDIGLYTAYEKHRDSDLADKVEAIFIATKEINQARHTANVIFEQEIGSDHTSDLEFGLAWQSLWRAGDELKAGFEYYGAFGELSDMRGYAGQDHQIGPVIAFDIPHTEVEMKLGYLAGISSDAFDSAFKWEFEWEF